MFLAVNRIKSGLRPSAINYQIFLGEIFKTTLREHLLGGGILILPYSGGYTVLRRHLILHR